jgi:hypothetical protein
MIPEWMANGDLPPGVHSADWPELEERLAFNLRRRRLLEGFREACGELEKAGCGLVYLDGSFVTTKQHPGDFDACWDIRNVDDEHLDPVFWDFHRAGPRRSIDSWASSFRHSCRRARREERSCNSSK